MALKKSAAAKKPAGNNKRGPKAKQVVEEKPEEDVEASDAESDEEDDDVSDAEVQGAADLVDSEAEEDDDDEDDEDEEDEEDDEVEPGQISLTKASPNKKANDDDESDSDDDEPVEAPITKQGKQAEIVAKGGIPRIPIGRIPKETPLEKIVYITNLPDAYKHTDLVALLAKFGPITVVNRVKSHAGGNSVAVAFESTEGASAAIGAKPKALTLSDQILNVSRPLTKDQLNLRTVAVGLVGPNATKEQLTEHFQSCGEIEKINFSNNKAMPTAYLRFKSSDSVAKALKLNSSEFHSRFITVRDVEKHAEKSPETTLVLANTGKHESYKYDVLEKIFKKHGDIHIDLVCSPAVMGFIIYNSGEQAQKALKALNGKTVGDLEIKLDPFEYNSSGRAVLVTNLANGVEEEELKALFNKPEEVESVKMLGNKAVVKFTTEDAFCKSFLMNERQIRGQPIFLEPNSMLKHKILQKKQGGGGKRPNNFRGNQSGGGGKRPSGGPGQFKKFGNNSNNKGFNKRPAQGNGNAPNSAKKQKKF